MTTDSEHFGLAGPVFASGATVRVARVAGARRRTRRSRRSSRRSRRGRACSRSRTSSGRRASSLDVHALKEAPGCRSSSTARSPSERSRSRSARSTTTPCRDRSGSAAPSRRARSTSPIGGAPRRAAGVLGAGVVRAGRRATSRARARSGSTPAGSPSRARGARDGARPRSGLALRRGSARRPRAAARLLAEHVQVVTPPGQAGLVTFRPEANRGERRARAVRAGRRRSQPAGHAVARASCGWWTSDED